MQDWLRDGDPRASLEALGNVVRKHPADPKLRVFLFQLLAVEGQWDRALHQLTIAGDLDAGNLAMVQTYRGALLSEALRDDVFAGKRSPLVFGEPASWIALLIEALRLGDAASLAEMKALREEAFEAAPATPGAIDDQPFEWIADADGRLGPILEAIINGRYYWVPYHRIRRIELDPPTDLRDLVWTPASFTWANGGDSVGLIPSRYPSSAAHESPQIRLARRTEWVAVGLDDFVGVGQRMLATDNGEYALMDIRSITLEPAVEIPGSGGCDLEIDG